MKLFAPSLRTRLILLVLLAAFPALALMLNSAGERRREATGLLEERALLAARLAATDHERLVDSTRQLLDVLVQQPQVTGPDIPTCRAFLESLLARHLEYTGFAVARTDGELTCVVPAPPGLGPVNLGDRRYFQMALATRGFAVGDYSIGRVSGRPTVVMALPVLGEDGRPRAVVSAGVDVAWLDQRVQESQLSDWTLTLLDRQGTVLARHPGAEGLVGRSLGEETPVLGTILQSRDAGVSEADDADGTTRLYAFVPMVGNGEPVAYLAISRPKSVAVAAANRTLVRDLAGLGVASAFAVFAAWVGADVFMLRQVRALQRASRQLSAGDLGARSGLVHPRLGPTELNELASAFDEMAESLAWHQRQRTLEEGRRLEIARAAHLQAELLPREAPTVAGFDLAARCVPAREVGGDFYDWVELAPGVVTLTLGDVMGKGMAAALLMATTRAALRAVTHAKVTVPAVESDLMRSREFVSEFHAQLVESAAAALDQDLARAGSFVTLFHAQLDAAERRIDYVDAGHGCVFLRRADGRVEDLRRHGLPLGVVARTRYSDDTLSLEPGDALVVYSDGLLDERSDLPRGEINVALARELDGAQSAEEMVARLIASLDLSGPPADDLTVLVLRCRE